MYETEETKALDLFALRPLLDPKKVPEAATLRRLQDALLEYISFGRGNRYKRAPRWIEDNETGCWNWIKSKVKGYGASYCQDRKHSSRAHMINYRLTFGEYPDNLELDHLCKNKACVNPYHLEPVPHEVNLSRGPNIKVTPKMALDIVEDHKQGLKSTAICNKYGLTSGTVSSLLSGHIWAWVTGLTPKPRKKISPKLITFDGRTQNLAQWVKETGIDRSTLDHRLERGVPIDNLFDAIEDKKRRSSNVHA